MEQPPALFHVCAFRSNLPLPSPLHSRLVLSNGLVNYIKLYLKHVDDRVINVQEGYNSVPTAGLHPQIETLYYIADERGYNVYRSE